ncbi:MAG: hypothetical protein ACFFA3_15265 [Promethearchaeota archaeon]
MFEPTPKEFANVKQLIREAKYDKALQRLESFETLKRNSPQDIVLIHLLKCFLFFEQALFKKASKFAEKVYNESLGLENKIFSVDALLIRALALLYSRDLETGNKCIEKGEVLLNSLIQLSDNTKNRRMTLLLYLKGIRADPSHTPPGDVELSLEYYKRSLSLAEPLHEENRVIASLIRIAWNISFNKGDLDLGFQYAERALALARDLNYKVLY